MARIGRNRWWIAAVLGAALSGCALLQSTPDEVPPAAPSAREFRYYSPAMRDEVLPPPRLFESREYLERLVCPLDEAPGWERTNRRGMQESYQIECLGSAKVPLALDTASEPPVPPQPLRLVEAKSFAHYREALQFAEKKEFAESLRAIDEALRLSPGERLYRRDRVSLLNLLGRTPEAIVEADKLLDERPTPTVYRSRALAAKALGLRGEFLLSIDGILRTAPKAHPLYAEAICAKGMFVVGESVEEGERYMREGCALDHKQCCDELAERAQAKAEAQRFEEAMRAVQLKLPAEKPHEGEEQAPAAP